MVAATRLRIFSRYFSSTIQIPGGVNRFC